jgi:hypothetical protein
MKYKIREWISKIRLPKSESGLAAMVWGQEINSYNLASGLLLRKILTGRLMMVFKSLAGTGLLIMTKNLPSLLYIYIYRHMGCAPLNKKSRLKVGFNKEVLSKDKLFRLG